MTASGKTSAHAYTRSDPDCASEIATPNVLTGCSRVPGPASSPRLALTNTPQSSFAVPDVGSA